MTKETKIYLSQSDLYNAIIDARIKGYMTEDLGNKFYLLATKCANHRNFVRYHHLKEEIIAIGAAACCKAYYKFRPFKDKEIEWDENSPITYDHNVCSNPHAFMTTVIFNDIIYFLKKEYKQANIVNEKRLEYGLDASYGYVDMMASKESEEREKGEQEPDDRYEGQTVWQGSDEEESDDDGIIDWQQVSS